MFKVKLVTSKNSDHLFRQTEGGRGISHCGKYKFYIDEPIENPDFLVVRNKYIKHNSSWFVAPENAMLFVSEPLSVVNFPKQYCNQFGLYYTCQENAKHKNIVFGGAALPWFIGGVDSQGNHSITYDKLKNSNAPQKTKLISVITSNKAFTQGHQDRIKFVAKLKAYYGELLDVYGRGVNDFDEKWDVLAPYKYHISIENSSSKYYWTEKISDCYLAGTFPIYYGCKNISDYFPEDGFRAIDIYNFEEAISIIDGILESDVYGKSLSVLDKCKDLVLNDYNLFNVISRCCDRLDGHAKKSHIMLYPSKTLFDWHNFKLYFFQRNFFVVKGFLKKFIGKNHL